MENNITSGNPAGVSTKAVQTGAETIRVLNQDSFTLAVCEQPKARLETFGRAALSDVELIALIIGGKPEASLSRARNVLNEAGGLAPMLNWTEREFQRHGSTPAESLRLAVLSEIGRRMLATNASEMPLMNRADLIAAFMAPTVLGMEVEGFWVLCLDRKNRLLRRVQITIGTATAALAHPREVFRAAIRESAAAIVCVHNHPSGDPAPSAPDMHATQMLREAAKAVDIELLDHVICGRAGADPLGRGYFSFREGGML